MSHNALVQYYLSIIQRLIQVDRKKLSLFRYQVFDLKRVNQESHILSSTVTLCFFEHFHCTFIYSVSVILQRVEKTCYCMSYYVQRCMRHLKLSQYSKPGLQIYSKIMLIQGELFQVWSHEEAVPLSPKLPVQIFSAQMEKVLSPTVNSTELCRRKM